MTVKEYLWQGYQLARGVRFKRERIISLRELAKQSTTVATAERVSGTSQRSKLENCVCQIDEWEREIDADIKQIRKIKELITKVDNLDYRQLLELRYVDGFTWGEVAERMNYTERWVKVLHGRALQRVPFNSPP